MIDLETFETENYDLLREYAAESGCDRELDYDWDSFLEAQYLLFIESRSFLTKKS